MSGSAPTRAQEVVRAQGMCGELLNDGQDICILAPGHGGHEEPEWPPRWLTPLRLLEMTLAEQQVLLVQDLCEKWESATDLTTGQLSIVARAFAAEVRKALAGQETS